MPAVGTQQCVYPHTHTHNPVYDPQFGPSLHQPVALTHIHINKDGIRVGGGCEMGFVCMWGWCVTAGRIPIYIDDGLRDGTLRGQPV